MKPLLLLALALAAPGFAEDPPAGSRDAAKLKSELADDFAGGVSLKQNQKKWTSEEAKAGAALEAVIARGVAVQEIATVPADIDAYEKEVVAVARAFGLDETNQARAVATYLVRLRAGGSNTMTGAQLAQVDQRLSANNFIAKNPALMSAAERLFGLPLDLASAMTITPFRVAGPVDTKLPPSLRVGREGDPGAGAAAIGAEVRKVKAEQAGLAARYNPDLRVPAANVPAKKEDAPWYAFWQGEDSTLGRLGRSVSGVPGVGSALDFIGGTGSTLYSGVVSVPGVTGVLREETQDRNTNGTALGTLWSGANVIGEAAPFLLLGPTMSASTRLLQTGQRAGTAATLRAVPLGLFDPANLLMRDPAPGAVITIKRVDPKAAKDGAEPEPER